MELTAAAHYNEDAKRMDKINEISMVIDRWLETNRQYHWNFLVRLRQRAARLCFCMNRREGTYLTGSTLFMLYLAVISLIFHASPLSFGTSEYTIHVLQFVNNIII